MTLLTCMGEILFDFMPIEEHGKTVGFRMHPGGSPFNVAVALARLGQPTAYVSKVSDDFFGRSLRAHIASEGIDTRFLCSSSAQTTLAFVAIEGGEPAFSFYGAGAADTLLTPDELPAALFAEADMLHIGSISLLRGSTPGAVVATAERLKGKALISFDPNVRPSLGQDEESYRALLDYLFDLADIIKVSAADVAWIAPEWSVAQFASDMLERGAALVIVTHGAAGALARRSNERLDVPALPVAVADTVGAGDAFSGGLLAALAERNVLTAAALLALPDAELGACLRFAAATAALSCTQAGANPPAASGGAGAARRSKLMTAPSVMRKP